MKVRTIISICIVSSSLLWGSESIDPVYAESEPGRYQLGSVVVSASKVEEYSAETGTSVIVIDKEQIQQRQYKTVVDAIKGVPGISVASNSVFGGTASVFLRGADSGHTLIMMDGIRLYDPISTNATYDLSNLTLDNVERIEIVKGPQSSLYGSDAMGGVINIITKKGMHEPKVNVSAEVASKNTYTAGLDFSGQKGNARYSLGSSVQESEGISKARDGNEEDEYSRLSLNSKVSYNVTEDLDVGIQGIYLRAKYDLDDGGFEDDPNYWMKYENALVSFFSNFRASDLWQQSVHYSWLRNTRQLFDDPDAVDSTEYYRAWFKGWLQEVDWQHTFNIGEVINRDDIDDTLVTGIQYTYEAGQEKSTYGDLARVNTHTTSYYIENKLGLSDSVFATAAFRFDDHSRFGSHTTGRVALSYLLDSGTRIKGSYGTGFNAPSLYQLFSDYGDSALQPERSWGYDAGVEQLFGKGKVQLSAIYFHNRFRDLIEYDFLKANPNAPGGFGQYVNVGSAKTEGVEAGLRWRLFPDLNVQYDYTYTEATDLVSQWPLVRRPYHVHTVHVDWRMWKYLMCSYSIIRNVKVYDIFTWGAVPERLKDYTVSNFACTYEVRENMDIILTVENIFDEVYQEVNGFSVKPRFFSLELKAAF